MGIPEGEVRKEQKMPTDLGQKKADLHYMHIQRRIKTQTIPSKS